MKPVSPVMEGFEDLEIVLGKNQPEYIPLPALFSEGPEGRMTTRWRFTDEERKKVSEGADIYLQQLTFGNPFHPVALGLQEEFFKEESRHDQKIVIPDSAKTAAVGSLFLGVDNFSLEPCKYFPKYLGKRSPTCGCAPCMNKYLEIKILKSMREIFLGVK